MLALGLGVGATTAIFSVLDAVVQPLPHAQPERLVALREANVAKGPRSRADVARELRRLPRADAGIHGRRGVVAADLDADRRRSGAAARRARSRRAATSSPCSACARGSAPDSRRRPDPRERPRSGDQRLPVARAFQRESRDRRTEHQAGQRRLHRPRRDAARLQLPRERRHLGAPHVGPGAALSRRALHGRRRAAARWRRSSARRPS